MNCLLVVIVAVQFLQIAAKCHHSEDVLVTVKQINQRFSTQTNVYFNFDNIHPETASQVEMPSLVITSPSVTFEFIYKWSKQILAVVHVTNNSNIAIRASLGRVLHKMHQVNVLFVLYDCTDPSLTFDWAWANGFKNSVALFWTEDKAQLAEFYPFPKLTWVSIGSIYESSLQKELTDFHGHRVRTPLADDPPTIFRYIKRNGERAFSGLFYKIFELFINHYNASLEEVALPPPYPFVFNRQDYMRAVQGNKIDIGLYPVPLENNEILTTDSFNLVFLHLMVPFAKPVQQSMYVLLPFQPWTWAGLAGALFLFTVGIYFVARRTTGQSDLGRTFLQVLSGILNISFPLAVYKSTVLLLLFILLSIAGIILSNMYLAQLSTFLTTPAYEKQINSIEDVIASDLPIASESSEAKVLKQLGVPTALLEKIQIVDGATASHNRRILNTSVISIVTKQRYRFFSHQQIHLRRPLVKLIWKPIVSFAPGYIMPFTSAYVSLYSTFIQRCIEHGIYGKFNTVLNDDGITVGLIAFIKDVAPDVVALNLTCFTVSWSLLAVGYAIGILCFFAEVIYFRLR